MKHQIHLKCWYLSTKLRGVISQMTLILKLSNCVILVGGEWSASSSCPFTYWKTTSGNYWLLIVKGKILLWTEPQLSLPMASHFTDWTILVHIGTTCITKTKCYIKNKAGNSEKFGKIIIQNLAFHCALSCSMASLRLFSFAVWQEAFAIKACLSLHCLK
jgi:hypothetical protein